jgi:tetratricopeptide (TPR) repeat protein
MRNSSFLALILLLSVGSSGRAGLYYSGETLNELPSQWRGFLLDQRTLRNAGIKPAANASIHPVRQRYEQEAARLEKASRERKLTADEKADLGALHVRLGDPTRAVEVLRTAQREHPEHFRIAANLGAAWQAGGDLPQAAVALETAVRLAPGKLQKAEEAHLKLVRLRAREAGGSHALDDLFGVRYVGPSGKFEPGVIAEEQRKKVPSDAVAVAQQLALWLPADARLLWQIAELANAFGDVRTAAAVLDGCVTEFALRHPDLKEHRQIARAAADELGKKPPAEGAKAFHEEAHAGGFKPKSLRPLANKLDAVPLPPVVADGVNVLPWSVLTETTVDRKFNVNFARYARELDGKTVTLNGYMQPLGDGAETNAFMLIEYPVGCWYCETPDVTGIVLVELPAGRVKSVTRGPVRVEGKLSLNGTDPENFLYTVGKAKVVDAD